MKTYYQIRADLERALSDAYELVFAAQNGELKLPKECDGIVAAAKAGMDGTRGVLRLLDKMDEYKPMPTAGENYPKQSDKKLLEAYKLGFTDAKALYLAKVLDALTKGATQIAKDLTKCGLLPPEEET